MEVDVDSFNDGCTVLYYSIDIGALTPLTGSFTASGAAQVKVHNITTVSEIGFKAVLNKIYYWVDAGNAVLSKVILEKAYGSTGTSPAIVHKFNGITGYGVFGGYLVRAGTGTITYYVHCESDAWTYQITNIQGAGGAATNYYIAAQVNAPGLVPIPGITYVTMYGSIATDLVYWNPSLTVIESL